MKKTIHSNGIKNNYKQALKANLDFLAVSPEGLDFLAVSPEGLSVTGRVELFTFFNIIS